MLIIVGFYEVFRSPRNERTKQFQLDFLTLFALPCRALFSLIYGEVVDLIFQYVCNKFDSSNSFIIIECKRLNCWHIIRGKMGYQLLELVFEVWILGRFWRFVHLWIYPASANLRRRTRLCSIFIQEWTKDKKMSALTWNVTLYLYCNIKFELYLGSLKQLQHTTCGFSVSQDSIDFDAEMETQVISTSKLLESQRNKPTQPNPNFLILNRNEEAEKTGVFAKTSTK